MNIEYEVVSGAEIHVELLTNTKLFCSCANSFGAKPNSQTCPVCAGLPGSLPVLNKEAVNMAIMLGLALECEIASETHFDRKNYFYPDNPQNYQITQLCRPICTKGVLYLDSGKKIRIKEMHLEDDAGKLIHEKNATYIDYNRSGVPLIEIVTEPDFSNAEELISFLKALIAILKELEICDCRMQEGSLRVDVNISVRPKKSALLGVRSEIKNINSFNEIRHVFEYEAKRKIGELKEGGISIQDTRGWDEKNQRSFFMREKENERDYRYFCEPDIPVLLIGEDDIREIHDRLPMLPDEKKQYLMDKYEFSKKEAEFLCKDKHMFKLFEDITVVNKNGRLNLKWLMGECSRLVNIGDKSWDSLDIKPKALAELFEMSDEGFISLQTAKELLEKLFASEFDVREYIEKNDLVLKTDEDALLKVAKQVIADNEKSVRDFFSGKDRALKYLIGQGMRLLKGRADVNALTRQIKELLADLEKCFEGEKNENE